MKARIVFLFGFLGEMVLGISLGSLVTFGFSFWTLHFTSFPNGNVLANLITFSGFIGILATAISGEGRAILAQLFLGLAYFGAVSLNNILVGLIGFIGILGATFARVFSSDYSASSRIERLRPSRSAWEVQASIRREARLDRKVKEFYERLDEHYKRQWKRD